MRNPVKNIVLIFFLLALMAAGIYEYFQLKKTAVPTQTAIMAIPVNASFILECRKPEALWKSVSQTNLIWQDLLEVENVSKLNNNLLYLDSLLSENMRVSDILEETPLFISAHTYGIHNFNYLFTCSVSGVSAQNALLSFIASKKNPSIGKYDGVILYTILCNNRQKFTYTISPNGTFICSFQPELVKESIRQLQSHISLMNNRYFTKVLGTCGNKVIANLFINFQELDNVVLPFLNNTFGSSSSSFTHFAQWLELDVNLTPNEIIMDGFADCDTTGSQYIGLFSEQLSQNINISSMVPAGTALMTTAELRDYSVFKKQYKTYLGFHNRSYKHNAWVEQMKIKYGLNPTDFFSWISNEIALVITEPVDSTLYNNIYAVAGTDDVSNALAALDSLSDSVAHVNKEKPEDIKFMQHDIRSINIPNLLGYIPGGMFNMFKKAFYTSVSRYVVFANSPEALQTFILQYKEGNTLNKNAYYQSFIKDHVENSSGLYVYNNIALSSELYKNYLNTEYAEGAKKYTSVWKNFQAVSMQISYMQGMYYTGIYFKRNPKFKKYTGSALWQAQLDTSVLTAPCWVTDYRTGDKFVFVQDKAYHIYLISNMGKIVWKRSVDGKIMSKVYEIDALRNNKIQYLFNTAKNIYGIDRDGNNLSGFPINLSSPATAPVSLFDYDSNKHYRILIPCADRIIREYDINARSVSGWLKPETKSMVMCPIKHLAIDEKDYLIAIDNEGKVYLYDRKGNVRLHLSHAMPAHISNYYTRKSNNISHTYIFAADSSGKVSVLSFTNNFMQKCYLADSGTGVTFIPTRNAIGKTILLFLNSGKIFAYDSTGELIFKCGVSDSLSTMQLCYYPNGKIGATDVWQNKVYLWNTTGALCKNFPLYGSIGFAIAEMNNSGQYYMVTGSTDNTVYVYSLP